MYLSDIRVRWNRSGVSPARTYLRVDTIGRSLRFSVIVGLVILAALGPLVGSGE